MRRFLILIVVLFALTVAACSNESTGPTQAPVEDTTLHVPSMVVQSLQEAMFDLGYFNGPIDGLRSDANAEAVAAFQGDNGLDATGVLDNDTLHAMAAASPDSRVSVVAAVQTALAELGFYTDVVDGLPGPNSDEALKAFQADVGVKQSGELDEITFDALAFTYYNEVTLPQYEALAASGVGGGIPEPPKVVPENARWNEWIRQGDSGPQVEDLQTRLAELGFRPGEINGVFGEETASAVMAFQKMEGLQRDAIVGPQVLDVLADPQGEGPQSDDPGPRVEVDLDRQIMFAVDENTDVTIINVSTGSGAPYQSAEAGKGIVLAHTPIGDYAVIRRIDGLREAPLGTLYRPLYFDGGWAIHGNPFVPGYPASHGCVRTDNWNQDFVFDFLADGDPVTIYGSNPPLPDNASPGA